MIFNVDRHASHLSQLVDGDVLIRWQKTPIGGDDIGPFDSLGWIAEGFGVSDLSPKIETAEEGKDFADLRTLGCTEFHRQLETRLLPINQLGTFAAAMCGRKQKDAVPPCHASIVCAADCQNSIYLVFCVVGLAGRLVGRDVATAFGRCSLRRYCWNFLI
jgi:hypothetical protein